jgi:hypothetical protein
MQINVQDVLTHLKMIHAEGLISDVYLMSDLACLALADDSGFMVEAGGTEVSLESAVGVLDLSLVISILNNLVGQDVYMSVENNRLQIYTDTTNFNLLTCAPEYVSTNKDSAYLQKILDFVTNTEVCSVTIDSEFASKFLSAYKIINADTTHINITPEGAQFVIGNTSENEVAIEVPDLQCDQPFSTTLPSRVLKTALSNLVGQEMVFTGEGSIVAVNSDEYRYIISPIAEG